MKKEELPQDPSALAEFTREVCYVKGKDGAYEQALSTGWNVKAEALDEAWKDINARIVLAADQVKKGEKSPVLFFMEVRLMDMQTLSGYTGFWGFTIKKHMKPSAFQKLSDKKLNIYARAFRITLEALTKFDGSNIDEYLQK